MKRRTRRRIARALLTCLAIAGLAGMASWNRWHKPQDEAAVAAQAMHERDVASCEQQIRPTLHGRVDGWRLTHEQRTSRGRLFTFLASMDDRSRLYSCEVDGSGTVLGVEASE
ncbi:MAG TPA: hypothetical protein VFG49_03890 [Dyella sp.]|uniref:hypothetical protein n=1 Tax=Dyella sp. TaxID=1869338 RepID=UPI002D782BE2|nr:hypothetical protein [Dyella sp.]HET6552657.1 hypothetical protein [Dyella sp.]